MKKYIIILTLFAALTGCTNLDEKVYSQIPKEEFFKNEELLTLYAGRAYAALQGYCSEQSLWTLNIQTGDECAIPRNAVNDWVDPRYAELQTHRFTVSNKLIRMGWDYCFNGIAACNDVIYETEHSSIQFPGKARILAEMRVLRAYFYFLAMDGWGNIPFAIDASDSSYPPQKNRAFVFDFIINEINASLSELDEIPTSKNYGRITQGVAYALLAKMYLNAEKYIGSARWAEAETACRAIMDAHHYIIEPRYKANFEVYNEASRENIFVLPYSTVYTKSDHNDFVVFIMTLAPAHSLSFNIPTTCWDGIVAQPDFFTSYDADDIRRQSTWLYGQQYELNGAPIDGFVIEPIFSDAIYSTGRTVNDGARVWKWTYQTDGLLTSDQTSMENDFALFRYADVVLMWAEALVRQGRAGEAVGNNDLDKIRIRAGLAPFTAPELTLDNLLAERGHELALEGWRRQDLIRFGKFNAAWWGKSVSLATTEIYPIPRERLGVNPNLTQNPGY